MPVPHQVAIVKLINDEAGKFADEIIQTFHKSGWAISISSSGYISPQAHGLIFDVPENPAYAQSAETVIEALKKAGLEYSIKRGDALRLTIGRKPFPKIGAQQ
jgi:hypothetical protein